MNSPLEFKKYIVTSKSEIAPDCVLLDLKGKFKFEPGQFVQIRLPHIGEATYAPCSKNTVNNGFSICVRACGNVSSQLIETQIGDSLLVRGPYGKSWPIGKIIGKNILIIAGGMGIVPLIPFMYDLENYKKEFGKISVLIGFKNPDQVLFEDKIKRFKKKFDYLKVAVEKTDSSWWGENCMITELIEKISISKDTIVLICGPEPMYKPVIKILERKKIALKNIYASFERRMECGVGFCQHCNIGKYKVCEDGPIFRWDKIISELNK